MPRLLARVSTAALVGAILTSLLIPIAAQAGAPTITPPSGCALPTSSDWTTKLVGAETPTRIIVGRADEDAARSIASASSIWRISDKQLRTSTSYLTSARPSYNGGDMDSFIKQGRAATNAAISLLYGSAVTGDGSYLQRVKEDALSFARFADWGPNHFLGVAEITTAVALEYSLTSSLMTSEERATVRDALITKALAPASCLWQSGAWQVTATHNWGAVTNAGMIVGALAIAEDNRELSAAVIARALPFYNRALDQARDGGSPEGPAYADLISRFASYVSSSLRLNFGAAGLGYAAQIPQSARYWNAIAGAKGKAFNYGDSNNDRFTPLLPIFNARTGGDAEGKELAQIAIDNGDTNTLLLLWYAQTDMSPPASGTLAQTFPVSGFTTLRSSASPAKTWLSIKAGSNTANHAHLDLGSFVLEMKGTRFVADLGADNYALPGYFGAQRNGYARVRTANHSTVTNNGQNQSVSAGASTSPITTPDGGMSVTVDMAAALGALTATRVFTVDAKGAVMIRDVAHFSTPTQLDWSIVTAAQIALSADRTVAILTLDGVTIQVRTYSAGSQFSVSSVSSSASPGYSNSGYRKLETVGVTAPASNGRYRAEAIVGFKLA